MHQAAMITFLRGHYRTEEVRRSCLPASVVCPRFHVDVFPDKADIVMGADGVASAVRKALCQQGVAANQSRFADRRPIVYRVLAIPAAEGDRTDLNYSARNDNVIVEALPNVEGSLLGVILFRPTDERIQGLKSGAGAKAVFQELFPEWPTPLIPDDEWEAFARRRTRELPQFAFAGPQLSLDGKSCLLGDAIHSVKPFFGLGLNSGFEDISVLDDCLDEAGCDPHEALQLYSRRRAPEAKCLVECQRRFDQPTDLRFALAFVLPLVLGTAARADHQQRSRESPYERWQREHQEHDQQQAAAQPPTHDLRPRPDTPVPDPGNTGAKDQPGKHPLLDDRPLRGNHPPHTSSASSSHQQVADPKPDPFAAVRDGRRIGGGKRQPPTTTTTTTDTNTTTTTTAYKAATTEPNNHSTATEHTVLMQRSIQGLFHQQTASPRPPATTNQPHELPQPAGVTALQQHVVTVASTQSDSPPPQQSPSSTRQTGGEGGKDLVGKVEASLTKIAQLAQKLPGGGVIQTLAEGALTDLLLDSQKESQLLRDLEIESGGQTGGEQAQAVTEAMPALAGTLYGLQHGGGNEHWQNLAEIAMLLQTVLEGGSISHPADVIAENRGVLTSNLARARRTSRARGIILELQSIGEHLQGWPLCEVNTVHAALLAALEAVEELMQPAPQGGLPLHNNGGEPRTAGEWWLYDRHHGLGNAPGTDRRSPTEAMESGSEASHRRRRFHAAFAEQDSIFSKALPAVFGPSILALFQDGELSFTAARRRKRRDRVLQVLLLVALLSDLSPTPPGCASSCFSMVAPPPRAAVGRCWMRTVGW
ncbi:Kynurenine 3-monooxygenase [Symbiodinium microadriaticum]|uniref:Kynurenine 3-monooxygenase n=1 Tax=Symbiodinium microadriaticum TaxID=2951 RepID=A0A1Q9F0R0_SYMMI|nr:Kynurenine 3-monooxygenase [Symbiodinium microadriaticum]